MRRRCVCSRRLFFCGASGTSPPTINRGNLVRRHNVLFLPFGFTDSRGRLSLQFIIMCGMPPKHLFVPPLFAKREDNILPYKRDFIQRRRAGQCLRSKLATERSGVCLHPAVTLFALSFGYTQTNGFLSISVGEGLAPPATLFVLSYGGAQTNGSLSILVGEGLAPPVLYPHSTKGSPVQGELARSD